MEPNISIPWVGCDDNTNKSSIYFSVVLSFHLELEFCIYTNFSVGNPLKIVETSD